MPDPLLAAVSAFAPWSGTPTEARNAVQAARTIDDAKGIADKAAALQQYARRAHDPEMENWVAEIRVRAKRRIGELSAVLEKAPCGPGRGKSLSEAGKPFKAATLKAAGISTTEGFRCEQLAAVPEPDFERFIAEVQARNQPVTGRDVARLIGKRERKNGVARTAERADCCTSADDGRPARWMQLPHGAFQVVDLRVVAESLTRP